MIWFGCILWHINICWLFNAKSSLYIFFPHTTCESTCDTLTSSAAKQGDNTVSVAQGFVGYLMPNPLYIYILNIYDLVWLDFMAYQPL